MESALELANTLHDTLWSVAGRFPVEAEQFYFGVEVSDDEEEPITPGVTITLGVRNAQCLVSIENVPTAHVREMLQRLRPWFRHYGRTPVVELDRMDNVIMVVDNYKYDDAGVMLPDQTGVADDDLEAGEEVYAHIVRMPLSDFVAAAHFPGPDPDLSLTIHCKQTESDCQRHLEFNVYYFLPKLIANVSEVPVPLFFSGSGDYEIPNDTDRTEVAEQICRCLGPFRNPLIEVCMGSQNWILSRKNITAYHVTKNIIRLLFRLAGRMGMTHAVLTDENDIRLFLGQPPVSRPIQRVFSSVSQVLEIIQSSERALHVHLYFPPVLEEAQKRDVARTVEQIEEQTGRTNILVTLMVKHHQAAKRSPISQRLEHRRRTGHFPRAYLSTPVPEITARPEAAAAPSPGGRTSRRPRTRSRRRATSRT